MVDDGLRAASARDAAPRQEAPPVETLDLHPIFRNDQAIYRAIQQALFRCASTGVDVLEIIPGRGSGTLKHRVLAFLEQRQLRRLYARVEADPNNACRILVHFR